MGGTAVSSAGMGIHCRTGNHTTQPVPVCRSYLDVQREIQLSQLCTRHDDSHKPQHQYTYILYTIIDRDNPSSTSPIINIIIIIII